MKPNRQWFFPICNTAFRGTLALFADIEIKNRDRLRTDGPVVYVCNHLSNLDPPIVASILPRRALFLAKREIFSNPLLSFLLEGWGAYPVSRYSADAQALRWVRAMLGIGRSVVMFPEGTRSRNLEGLKTGHVGAAWVASQTGATLVPIGIHGTDNLQNILKVLTPIAKIRISVGEPFKINSCLNGRADLRLATNEIMSRIAQQLPAERRGVYADTPPGYELTSDIGAQRSASTREIHASTKIPSPEGRRSV